MAWKKEVYAWYISIEMKAKATEKNNNNNNNNNNKRSKKDT